MLQRNHQDFKTILDDGRSGLRLFFCRGRRFAERGRHEIGAVLVQVIGHGSRALFGGQVLQYRKVVGVFFLYQSQCSVSIRAEGYPKLRVKTGRVRRRSDGDFGDDFSSAGIQYHHFVIGAYREQAVVLAVYRSALVRNPPAWR